MTRPRYASTLLFAALLLALPACDSGGDDGDNGEDRISIEGAWQSEQIVAENYDEGEYAVVDFDFDTDGRDVSGSGTFGFFENGLEETALDLDGDYNPPILDVTASYVGTEGALEFECEVQNESSMECDLFEEGEAGPTGVDFDRQ